MLFHLIATPVFLATRDDQAMVVFRARFLSVQLVAPERLILLKNRSPPITMQYLLAGVIAALQPTTIHRVRLRKPRPVRGMALLSVAPAG